MYSLSFIGVRYYQKRQSINQFLQQPLLNMQGKHELTSNYIALLDQIRNLLSRQNLCNNNYLFKHIKNNLTLPLYAFAQQRKIAQITTNEQDIVQALQESGLAIVYNPRQVVLIEYPTIKISVKNQQIFEQIEKVLKQHEKRYSFSQRIQKQFVNLTLYEQDPEFLEKLVPSLSKEVQFEKVSLIQDMKEGVNRIKKIKMEQKTNGGYKNGTNYKYSLDKPPQIFIRKAMDSSDQEEEDRHKSKQLNDKKKKYKEVTKQKESPTRPVFNSDDFPSLS